MQRDRVSQSPPMESRDDGTRAPAARYEAEGARAADPRAACACPRSSGRRHGGSAASSASCSHAAIAGATGFATAQRSREARRSGGRRRSASRRSRGRTDRLGCRAGVLRHGPRAQGRAQAHRLHLRPGAAPGTRPRAGDRAEGAPGAQHRAPVRDPRLFNVTIYEQAEDPKQHFTIRELKALSREEFLALVRERVGGSRSFKDQAVVFVHGYNTAFDYALYRTAQMAYDLKFDGAVLPLQLAVRRRRGRLRLRPRKRDADRALPEGISVPRAEGERRQERQRHRPQHGQPAAAQRAARSGAVAAAGRAAQRDHPRRPRRGPRRVRQPRRQHQAVRPRRDPLLLGQRPGHGGIAPGGGRRAARRRRAGRRAHRHRGHRHHRRDPDQHRHAWRSIIPAMPRRARCSTTSACCCRRASGRPRSAFRSCRRISTPKGDYFWRYPLP